MLRIIFYLLIIINGYVNFTIKDQASLYTFLIATIPALILFLIFDLLILSKFKLKSTFILFFFALISLCITALIQILLNNFGFNINPYYMIFIAIVLLYISLYVSLTQSHKLSLVVPQKTPQDKFINTKILDTSIIIDGRILDICETGFIDGPFILPTFVLKELQMVADSADHQKRIRGRRGLDVLNSLKQSKVVTLMIDDTDFPDVRGVDSKLMVLAKQINGKIITTDYNLNKTARVDDIPVLNINDLANAMKSIFLPGERFKIIINKEGKEKAQGIGYLDDGTMVVVEDGRKYINKEKLIHVTSVIQNPSGRIIFGKVKP